MNWKRNVGYRNRTIENVIYRRENRIDDLNLVVILSVMTFFDYKIIGIYRGIM